MTFSKKFCPKLNSFLSEESFPTTFKKDANACIADEVARTSLDPGDSGPG
jgi:hypothetical protein